MSYLESIKFNSLQSHNHSFEYNNTRVNVITVFNDINTAIIEDNQGNILEVPADTLTLSTFE
jgi:hypothetical protein